MKIKIYSLLSMLLYLPFFLFPLNEIELGECETFYYLCNEGKYTSICNILQNNSPQKNRMLLQYKSPQTKNTAFLASLTHNFALLARLLLMYGAHPLEPTEEGLSPIHLAATIGNIEIIQLLLTKRVPIDLQTTYSLETALHYAALHNQQEVVDFLITEGARIDIADCAKRLPLHCAVLSENQLITKTLLLAKPEIINARDINGKTSAHYLASTSIEYQRWFLKTYKRYINFSIQDDDGNTPLHIAIYIGFLPTIVSFLLLNPPLKTINHRELTPLELAKDLELDSVIEAIHLRERCK